tara:strand:- start:6 stop:383 length:378 start_codon:yes stop_codon:yes gene_type:complete
MTKYFAKLSLNSKVIKVNGVADRIATTEQDGIDYLNKLYNYPFWVQCSKDASIRKNGAGIGMTYDEDRDAFIPKKPYPSWILNETTCGWEAPVAYPGVDADHFDIDVDKVYQWNEETTSWDEIVR